MVKFMLNKLSSFLTVHNGFTIDSQPDDNRLYVTDAMGFRYEVIINPVGRILQMTPIAGFENLMEVDND